MTWIIVAAIVSTFLFGVAVYVARRDCDHVSHDRGSAVHTTV